MHSTTEKKKKWRVKKNTNKESVAWITNIIDLYWGFPGSHFVFFHFFKVMHIFLSSIGSEEWGMLTD